MEEKIELTGRIRLKEFKLLYDPQPDITTYELAIINHIIFKSLLNPINTDDIKELLNNPKIARHFTY